MFYNFSISTPANKLEKDKQKTVLKLSHGVIHKVGIVFPPGPLGYLHLHINRALNQVWPTNPGEDFSTDSEVISWAEFYELPEPPYELEAYTWTEGSTYPHIVIIRFAILPKKYIRPELVSLSERLFGR